MNCTNCKMLLRYSKKSPYQEGVCYSTQAERRVYLLQDLDTADTFPFLPVGKLLRSVLLICRQSSQGSYKAKRRGRGNTTNESQEYMKYTLV